MKTVNLNVPSISCNAWVNKIKEGMESTKGIENLSVDLKSQMVQVDYNPEFIDANQIVNKISSIGYEVIP